jgi:predicted transcriptional regulator
MFKDEILENKRRNKIYNIIKVNPGCHIRELQRMLNIPLTSLQYHLNYMARRNIIVEEKSEHYTQYYSAPLDSKDKKILSALRQKSLREIVLIILVSKKAKYQLLIENLNMPSSTVSFYLKCLMENDIIERTKIGYENIYTMKDSESVEKMLIMYQSSFLDKLVDRWARTWLENRFVKEKKNGENQIDG